MRSAPAIIVAAALLVSACDDTPSKAEKQRAKRVEDAALLELSYPSAGGQPKTMEIAYDPVAGRTGMRLRLSGLRITGRGAGGGAMLHLTSTFEGRERARDNPEGSVDGALVVQTARSGALAYSGPPGTVTVDGRTTPLREPADGAAYLPGVPEESVRFRFPTADLVAAATSERVVLTFGTVEVELSDQALADLREFAARLNPRP